MILTHYIEVYGKKKRRPIHVRKDSIATWYFCSDYPEKYRKRLIQKAQKSFPFEIHSAIRDMLLHPNLESIRRREEFLSDLKDLNVDLSNGEITATMEDLW